jgi:sulfoxide reductase heme-binding subunit YedZ
VHVTRSSLDWYVARGAGITAWVLLTLVVLLGTGLAARLSRLQPRLAVENVHRFASLLAATFVAVHVVAIAIDSWLPFTLRQLLVPLAARYRPSGRPPASSRPS